MIPMAIICKCLDCSLRCNCTVSPAWIDDEAFSTSLLEREASGPLSWSRIEGDAASADLILSTSMLVSCYACRPPGGYVRCHEETRREESRRDEMVDGGRYDDEREERGAVGCE